MKTFTVNLQQGFILTDEGIIIAAYHNHHKLIVMKVPFPKKDLPALPKWCEDYKIHEGVTDSFSIQMWTTSGTLDISPKNCLLAII